MKPKPIIDELLDEHFPKRYYGRIVRKHAKELALEFFKSVRQEYAMNDEINTALFLGRELSNEEKQSIRIKWGYVLTKETESDWLKRILANQKAKD